MRRELVPTPVLPIVGAPVMTGTPGRWIVTLPSDWDLPKLLERRIVFLEGYPGSYVVLEVDYKPSDVGDYVVAVATVLELHPWGDGP